MLKFWMRETTKFPISNINLAANYILEFYGMNVVIGVRTLHELITDYVFSEMVVLGYLHAHGEEAFIFIERS